MSSKTNAFNSYETSLNGGITDSATSLTVDANPGPLNQPAYMTLEPDDPLLREIILVAVISGTAFSSITRGLPGSAAGAQAHSSGAIIRSTPVHQQLDDVFTDIAALEAADAGHFGGTDIADHPEATPSVRGFISAADKTNLDALVVTPTAHQATHQVGDSDPLPFLVPTGAILPFAAAAAPTDYLLCDGAAVSEATYADLFALIAYTYGNPGGGNFNVPDMQQVFPLGLASSGAGSSMGDTGGSIDHTHTGPSHVHTMPTHVHGHGSHSHTMPTHTHTNPTTGPANGVAFMQGDSIAIAAATHTHTQGDTGARDPGDTNATDPGNTDATDPGDTNAAGTGATGTQNPPFLAVQYIIKT